MKTTRTTVASGACALLGLVGALTLACGNDDGRDSSGQPGQFTSLGASASGSGTGGGFDDGSSDGGGGTGIKLDVSAMSAGDEGSDPSMCESLVDEADVGPRPQDIIVVIDNSGSMSEEAGFVQQFMNSFSIQIAAANIDSHIILISAYPTDDAGVCIDPPLGAGGCPAADSDPPSFVHIDSSVGSNNALQKIITHYPDYSAYLRQTAVTHMIVVTDDDADMAAADFIGQMSGLSPHLSDFVFHGIISPEDGIAACLGGTTCCGLAADQGKVYQSLIATTGGIEGNLCEQQFQPIFQAVAQQVIGGASLSCSFDIPPPPPGESFDPDEVNVEFDDGQGGSLQIGRVDSPAECGAVTDGWYYDNPADPSIIVVCPQTCTKIQGFAQASIAVIFGCETIPAG